MNASKLRFVEFCIMWLVRNDKIWNTIAGLGKGGLKELRLEQLSVSEEEMVGDAFWRAYANTEMLRLKRCTISLPTSFAMLQEAFLDLDAGVLSRASISDYEGDDDGNWRSAVNTTGAGIGGGERRPYSFSRVKHLEILGPFIMKLDEL